MPASKSSSASRIILSAQRIRQIQDCFSSQGAKHSVSGRSLYWYEASHWRTPVMSPLFLQKKILTASELKKITQSFAESEVQSPHNYQGSYLCILKDAYFSKLNSKVLSEAHWYKDRNKTSYLNIWISPEKTPLPKGLRARVGDYFDREIHRDLWQLLDRNFKSPPSFRKYMDLWHQQVKEDVRAVLIYDQKSPIACGLVVQGRTGAFLYCGAVDKKYRQQGLWRCLVSLRQSILAPCSHPIWVMISQNPQIQKKGHSSWPLEIYYKNEIT